MEGQLHRQERLQHSIARALDNLKKLGKSNLTPAKIRSRMTSLKDTWHDFQSGHDDLVNVTPETKRSSLEYFRTGTYEHTEEIYNSSLDDMAERLEELEPYGNSNKSLSGPRKDPAALSLSNLPPIQLPPFDGRYEEWESFRDRFSTLIRANPDLNDFARMHYLASCLKGGARECIANLAITAENFETAWRALAARYENPQRLLKVHFAFLFQLPNLARESASDLQNLIDKVQNTVAALKGLKRTPAELWSDFLVYTLLQKLDARTRKAWNMKVCEQDSQATFDELMRFLAARARALEEFTVSSAGPAISKPAQAPRIHVATASTDSRPACPICSAGHFLNVCPKFLSRSPLQRREVVKKSKRCFNCLSVKHPASECRSKYSCRICSKKHHSLLHLASDSLAGCSEAASPGCSTSFVSDSKTDVNSLSAVTPSQRLSSVLLATAWITVGVPGGRRVHARALLDQGSEMTLITENLAQLLRAKRQRTSISVSAVGSVHAGTFR